MSTIYLTAILEDGTKRAILVPPNPRQPIQVTKGETTTLRVRVIYPTGTAVDLTGSALVWTAKRNSDDSNPAVMVSGTLLNAPLGSAEVVLPPATFKYIDAGRLVYDLWLTTSGGARYAVIPLSPLFLGPTVAAVP